jgi:hypothetical protein
MVTQMVVMTGSYLYLENLLIDKNHFPTDNRSNANPPQTNGAHGGNVGIWLNACNYCQVNGNESLNTTQSGVFISIMGNYIHDVGTTSDDQGIYYYSGSGSMISNNVIRRAYDFGIQLYPNPYSVIVATSSQVIWAELFIVTSSLATLVMVPVSVPPTIYGNSGFQVDAGGRRASPLSLQSHLPERSSPVKGPLRRAKPARP